MKNIKKPLISIIVPVYNTEKFIKKNIATLLNQSYSNIEIILINDGSTDNSLKYLNDLKQSDDRIIVINQNNMGLSGARNSGIKRATGEYLMFMDSDDYFKNRNSVKNIISTINENNPDLIIFGFELVFLERNKSDMRRHVSDRIEEMYLGVWNKVYKKCLIEGESFPNGKYYEDGGFVIQAWLKSKHTVVIDKPFYAYVQHAATITSVDENAEKHLDVIEVLKPIIKSKEFEDADILVQQAVIRMINYQILTHVIVMLGISRDNMVKHMVDEMFGFQEYVSKNKKLNLSSNFYKNKILIFINTCLKRNPDSLISRDIVKLINLIRKRWRE